MLDYYGISAQDFQKHSRIQFEFVERYEDLCQSIAREMLDLVRTNAARGEMTRMILPIGPLDYRVFADLCNLEGVSCESLVIISMDEYVQADGHAIPSEHPLSFRTFYQKNLMDRLDRDKRFPPEQLILPNPDDLGAVEAAIQKYGPVDVVYGGMGVNGHFAFNIPPRTALSVDEFKQTTVRIIDLSEGDIVQMAIGGTGGNLEMIPPKACTVGMKELLSAKLVHLTFMRSWHAGVLRRALFGPVTSSFPGSLVQLHPNVKATISRLAAEVPPLDLLLRQQK